MLSNILFQPPTSNSLHYMYVNLQKSNLPVQ